MNPSFILWSIPELKRENNGEFYGECATANEPRARIRRPRDVSAGAPRRTFSVTTTRERDVEEKKFLERLAPAETGDAVAEVKHNVILCPVVVPDNRREPWLDALDVTVAQWP
jgi:hypothetical protein